MSSWLLMLRSVFLACAVSAVSYGDTPASGFPTVYDAPVVVIGVARPLKEGGTLGMHGRQYTRGAEIQVERVIKGAPDLRIVRVRMPDSASEQEGWQVAWRKYVLFLLPTKDSDEFRPARLPRYSMCIEHVPVLEGPGAPGSVAGALRLLGRANVAASSAEVRELWMDYMQSSYDEKEDKDFFLCLARDRTLSVHERAKAVRTLLDRSPQTPGICDVGFEILVASTQAGASAIDRGGILAGIEKILGRTDLTRDVLRAWLRSGVPEVEDRALTLIFERRDHEMVVDLRLFLQRKEDEVRQLRRGELRCINVLNGMTRRRSTGVHSADELPPEMSFWLSASATEFLGTIDWEQAKQPRINSTLDVPRTETPGAARP
jgi:hypothetical protein